eukprot:6108877-Pyramimonas_sp.AAC.2
MSPLHPKVGCGLDAKGFQYVGSASLLTITRRSMQGDHQAAAIVTYYLLYVDLIICDDSDDERAARTR